MKFDLADVLRTAASGLSAGDYHAQEQARALHTRLAEDRFNLVVVGRFSRGKTSLMNAILGMERLPTGVIPITSVITTVTYGSDEKVVLYFKHTSLFTDIPLSALEAHITERGNPSNVKRISYAEVQLPSDILRRGFHLVDTPGLGSSILENTRTTEAFLPEADAFILVTSFDSPLSKEEIDTLRTIVISGRRCFVVINKQDAVSVDDRNEVEAHVQAQLLEAFGSEAPSVHSVSARQALNARITHDESSLDESGLLRLESSLIDFMVREKHQQFLLGLLARIREVGRQDAQVVRRLEVLRELVERPDAVDSVEGPGERGLQEAGMLPDCAICKRVSDDVFDFIAQYQSSLRSDPQARARNAAVGGLCGHHAEHFQAIAAPLEICIGFAPVMERQASRLREAVRSCETSECLCEAIQDALPTGTECAACEIAQGARRRAVAEVVRQLRSAGGFAHQSRICLPHIALVAKSLPLDAAQRLIRREADILDSLHDDMKRFGLKQDGGRRYLASREELDAGRRGLRALTGTQAASVDGQSSDVERKHHVARNA